MRRVDTGLGGRRSQIGLTPLEIEAHDGVVDASEEIPLLDESPFFDANLCDATHALGLHLHPILGLDGSGRVDGVDGLPPYDRGHRDLYRLEPRDRHQNANQEPTNR